MTTREELAADSEELDAERDDRIERSEGAGQLPVTV